MMLKTVKLTNPTANHRLSIKALRPTGHFCLARLDAPPTKTKGGLIVPLASLEAQYAGAAVGNQAERFRYDHTAEILKLGPDVENVEVGDRILLTVHVIPVTVNDGSEENPLGLFDARDIVCKVV